MALEIHSTTGRYHWLEGFFYGSSATIKIETPPCHFAGVVARQTRSANIRSHGIDSARRQYAYLSHKRRTAITAAAHASKLGIDKSDGD
jgi:hypothetical protein